MWGEAERRHPVQFLEEKQQERSIDAYKYLIKGLRDDGARLVHKLEHGKF